MDRNKIVTADALAKVRLALYNAKHAIESQFDGKDRDEVIRSIIEALDVTRDLGNAP